MSDIYRDRALADAAVDRLKAFAQPQRLMILSLLLSGEFTVGEIDEATRIGQPALSQQLAELRRAGLVTTRKVAKTVRYSLARDETSLCVRLLEAVFTGKGDPAGQIGSILDRLTEPKSRPNAPTGAASFARLE